MRMVADVPLGVMLSGGLDSSLITAIMAERSTRPVQTFSIAFAEDGGSNELGDALRVAERLGTDHHALTTSAVDHPDLLDEALWHMEEPVADVSCLGFLLLSRLARETVTVALSGQGADELLGGYRKHEIAALATNLHRAPAVLRRAAAAAARTAPAGSTLARGLAAVTTDDPVERLLAMSRVVQSHERAELLDPAFMHPGAEDEIAAVVRRQLAQTCPRSPLGETLHLDTRLALVDNMLLYFDKMSMATSLEVRVPFMDHKLVEFCTRLPDSRRIYHGRRKEILKRASRGLVEDAIIDKPKRGFFHSALGAWLGVHRDALVRETLLDGRALARGQYRADAVERLILEAGGAAGKKSSQRLFCLLLLERWQRLFVDGEAPGALRRRAARARLLSMDAATPDLSVVVVTHNGPTSPSLTLRAARERLGADQRGVARRRQRLDRRHARRGRGRVPGHRGPAAAQRRLRRRQQRRAAPRARPPRPAPQPRHGDHARARSPSWWRAMDARPEVGASSVIQEWPEGGVQPTIRRFPSPGRQLSEALMLPRLPGLRAVQEEEQRIGAYDEEVSCDWLVGGFLLVRRDAIEQVGGLDERFFLFSEEADWCLRLREGGWDIRHLPAHDRHAPHGPLRAPGPVRPELVLQAALRAQALPGAGAARLPLRARPAPCRASRPARPPGRAAARPAQPGQRGAPCAERRAGARPAAVQSRTLSAS